MAADGKTPPTHPQVGGPGTLCVQVVSSVADTKTPPMTPSPNQPPCWDTHILTLPTDRQRHTGIPYINQYKHIVIPVHGCICVTYPPFGGGGNQGGWIIYIISGIKQNKTKPQSNRRPPSRESCRSRCQKPVEGFLSQNALTVTT